MKSHILVNLLIAFGGYYIGQNAGNLDNVLSVVTLSSLKLKAWINIMMAAQQVISPTVMQRRGLMDGVLTQNECKDIMKLMMSDMTKEQVGDELKGKSAQALWKQVRRNSTDQDLKRQWDLYWNVQNRILKIVRDYFQAPEIYLDFVHLTARTPGHSEFSHGIHADQCAYNYVTKQCIKQAESCCGWHDWSALLYLNDAFTGGEFIFADDNMMPEIIVKPTCGRIVFFTSGAENLHGVNRVIYGTRYAVASWLTSDVTHRAPNRQAIEETQ